MKERNRTSNPYCPPKPMQLLPASLALVHGALPGSYLGYCRFESSPQFAHEELRALVPSLQEEAAQALEGSMGLMSYFFLSFVLIFSLLFAAVFIRLLLTDNEAVEIDLREVEAESEEKVISQSLMESIQGFNAMALPVAIRLSWSAGNVHYIL